MMVVASRMHFLSKEHLLGYEKKVRPLRDALEKGILDSNRNTD